MTFEKWMKYKNYSLKGIDEDDAEFLMREAWYYQQKRIETLEHKLSLHDAFIAGMTYPKVSITDDEGNVRLQTDDFGNVSIGTVQEEVERLRAKKKQIYEDLKDAVESECVAIVGNWGKVEWKEGITPQLGAKLFASPSKREWVGLTDDEVEEVFSFPFHYRSFYKAVEAKLKEKNGG